MTHIKGNSLLNYPLHTNLTEQTYSKPFLSNCFRSVVIKSSKAPHPHLLVLLNVHIFPQRNNFLTIRTIPRKTSVNSSFPCYSLHGFAVAIFFLRNEFVGKDRLQMQIRETTSVQKFDEGGKISVVFCLTLSMDYFLCRKTFIMNSDNILEIKAVWKF